MTTKALKEAIDRVQHWPEERQDDAAKMLLEGEAQDASGCQLREEQVAEVKRRIADPNPKFLTLADVQARLSPPVYEGNNPRLGVFTRYKATMCGTAAKRNKFA
jgi:hypothetical protein